MKWRLCDLATLNFNAGRSAQAIRDCARGLDIAPSDYELLRVKARASVHLNQWRELYDACSRILEVRPDEVVYWPLRLRAVWELGHKNEALANASNLIDLADKNPKSARFRRLAVPGAPRRDPIF